jgi:hypothetical protein
LKFGDGYLVCAADFFPFSRRWCTNRSWRNDPNPTGLLPPDGVRVIRSGEVYTHHPEERTQKPLGLTEWQVEEKTQRRRVSMATSEYFHCPPRVPTPAGFQVAIAAGDTHRVTSPRPTRARS